MGDMNNNCSSVHLFRVFAGTLASDCDPFLQALPLFRRGHRQPPGLAHQMTETLCHEKIQRREDDWAYL